MWMKTGSIWFNGYVTLPTIGIKEAFDIIIFGISLEIKMVSRSRWEEVRFSEPKKVHAQSWRVNKKVGWKKLTKNLD